MGKLIKIILCILFIYSQSSFSQNSDELKKDIIDEFKNQQKEEGINNLWRYGLGLEFIEENAIFSINKSEGIYWIIEYEDKRKPGFKLYYHHLSDLALPEDINLESGPSKPFQVEKNIEITENCNNIKRNPPLLEPEKSQEKICIKMLSNEEVQNDPDLSTKINKIINEQNIKPDNIKIKRMRDELSQVLSQYDPTSIAAGPIPTCQLNKWSWVRDEACGVFNFVANRVADGVVVGTVNFVITQKIYVSGTSSIASESFDISFVSAVGRWSGMNLFASAGCSSGCSIKLSTLPFGEQISVPSLWTRFVDSDGSTNSVNPYKRHYAMQVGPVPVNEVRWESPEIRCDKIAHSKITGCVFPGAAGLLETMKDPRIPQITQNIRLVQDFGPNHYGKYQEGKPLQRTRDESIKRANNRAACPPKFDGPRPSPDYNCDEYPFASTLQGASRVGHRDWGSRWVLKTQNNTQGQLLGTFYLRYRILESDYFWVDVQ